MLPRYQFGDDVVVVSASTLWKSASSQEQKAHTSTGAFSTTVSWMLSAPIGCRNRADPINSTLMQHNGPATAGVLVLAFWAVPESLCDPWVLTQEAETLSCTAALWFIAAMQNRSSGQRANFMTNKHGRTHPFQAVVPTQNLSEASTPGWACMLSPNLWGGRANKKASFVRPFMPHQWEWTLRVEASP